MKRRLGTLLGIATASLWSIAHATTVTYNYNFSGTTQNTAGTGTVETGGMLFSASPQIFDPSGPATAPPLAIYGETAPAGLVAPVGGNDGGPSKFGTTIGLFEVTSGAPAPNTATGIAPYRSDQASGTAGNLNFTLEDGITENNVLLIDLHQFVPGSTVSFVMATGAQATAHTGINVWTGTPSTTPPLGFGTGWTGQTAGNSLTTESIIGGDVNGSAGGAATKTFTLFTNNLPAGEWIAIQADCHYLLLQSITITSPAPEPSFYGFLSLAMIGLVFGARKLRAARAVAVSNEQA